MLLGLLQHAEKNALNHLKCGPVRESVGVERDSDPAVLPLQGDDSEEQDDGLTYLMENESSTFVPAQQDQKVFRRGRLVSDLQGPPWSVH